MLMRRPPSPSIAYFSCWRNIYMYACHAEMRSAIRQQRTLLKNITTSLGLGRFIFPHTTKKNRIQNPDIPRAGRSGAAHSGGAGGAERSGAGQGGAGWSSGARRGGMGRRDDAPRIKPSACPPEHRRQPSWTFFRMHEQH